MESPYKSDILKGKVALLTGGGSGIGFEISKQFGSHGASIAIMGRRQQVIDSAVSDLHSLGIPAAGFVGDVRSQDDAKRVVESTVKRFGRLDILVNSAAGNFLVPSDALSPKGFKTVMDIVISNILISDKFIVIKKLEKEGSRKKNLHNFNPIH